jgi:hypothetical protein
MDQAAVDVADTGATAQRHCVIQFIPQQLQDMLNACLTIDRQTP